MMGPARNRASPFRVRLLVVGRLSVRPLLGGNLARMEISHCNAILMYALDNKQMHYYQYSAACKQSASRRKNSTLKNLVQALGAKATG
jgi:hypothetical protein